MGNCWRLCHFYPAILSLLLMTITQMADLKSYMFLNIDILQHRMVRLRSSPQYIPDHFIMAFSSSLTTRALPPTQQLVVCFQFLKTGTGSGGPTSIFVLACHSSLPPITSCTHRRFSKNASYFFLATPCIDSLNHGVILPSTHTTVSAIHVCQFSGLNHFNLSAYGLPFLLSTLRSSRYLHEPKTRCRAR